MRVEIAYTYHQYYEEYELAHHNIKCMLEDCFPKYYSFTYEKTLGNNGEYYYKVCVFFHKPDDFNNLTSLTRFFNCSQYKHCRILSINPNH